MYEVPLGFDLLLRDPMSKFHTYAEEQWLVGGNS